MLTSGVITVEGLDLEELGFDIGELSISQIQQEILHTKSFFIM